MLSTDVAYTALLLPLIWGQAAAAATVVESN